jgi:hypothetical protein
MVIEVPSTQFDAAVNHAIPSCHPNGADLAIWTVAESLRPKRVGAATEIRFGLSTVEIEYADA